MAMQEIKSFKIVPTCLVIACVYGIIAVISSIGMFVGGLVHGHAAVGLFILVVRPLRMFASAIMLTALGIWFYNQIAPHVGGIQIEAGDIKEQ